MPSLARVFKEKMPTFSFEVFPAKTQEGHARLLETVERLCSLGPDFISCTYGAGGGNRERTFDIVEHIQKTFGIPAVAHLTCVSHTRAEIARILDEFDRRGIGNVLTLRGDMPEGGAEGHFRHSIELVELIRARFGEKACIGVAGFPEKHLLSKDADSDANFLKRKIDSGADFVITQLFFDNRLYFDYVARLRKIGVGVRILPGILPITDYDALKRFCAKCGAGIPMEVHEIFAPVAGDPEKTMRAGIEFAIRQCRELLARGVPGIHFYTLNKTHPTEVILRSIRPA